MSALMVLGVAKKQGAELALLLLDKAWTGASALNQNNTPGERIAPFCWFWGCSLIQDEMPDTGVRGGQFKLLSTDVHQ